MIPLFTFPKNAKSSNSDVIGKNISLNFQDIEVRAALKIIADFSGFNLIVNDTVKGNVTLHLNNVPWEQALDIILKMKGLDKRKNGNILLVGPALEIVAREKLELESEKQMEDLGPLKLKLIQIHYAKAEDLASLLKEKKNTLMTNRGNVTVDNRTNTLLVQDIEPKLKEINALLKTLDIPVRQVEIFTQIVTADTSFEESLGARLGFQSKSLMNVEEGQGLFNDFGSSCHGGLAKFGFSLATLPKETQLELELQALEYESKIKTISRPRLLTVSENKAHVEQGFEIPYQEASASGATSTSFRKAALKLEVTPHITADNKITLDLMISNDTPSNITNLVSGTPGEFAGSSIGLKTARLKTQVLVDNGATLVLGGVLSCNETETEEKVPFLGDIPLLGNLFKHRYQKEDRKELLIFITPKIVMPCK